MPCPLRGLKPSALLSVNSVQIAPVGAGLIPKSLPQPVEFCVAPAAKGIALALMPLEKGRFLELAGGFPLLGPRLPPAMKLRRMLAAAVLGELALTAQLVIDDPLLAPDFAVCLLIGFGPCRQRQKILRQLGGNSGLGIHTVNDDMNVGMRLVVVPDEERLVLL